MHCADKAILDILTCPANLDKSVQSPLHPVKHILTSTALKSLYYTLLYSHLI